MADSSDFTPSSYDQYVAGILKDTDSLLAPPKTKAAPKAPSGASLKTQAGPYDAYISDTLKDVDKLLAPPKAPPKDLYSPEGGPMDDIMGGAQGAINTVKNLFTGAAGQALGLADIPVHAGAGGVDKLLGTNLQKHVYEPQEVEEGVTDLGTLHPGTRRGERAGQLVQEAAQDILGTPGRIAGAGEKVLTENTGKDDMPMTFMQAQTGVRMGPGTEHQQSDYELGIAESVGNAAAMVAGGRAPEARGAPLEEPVEPPPPPGAPPGGPEYTAPEVNKKTKDDDDDDDGGGGGPRQNRRKSGLPDEVRKVYDGLTPKEKETTSLQDPQTMLYSRGIYDRLGAGSRPQVFFDLRDLKQANDVHGHSYGDAVIKAFGDAARAAGVSGQMFRYGGDEFTMLVDGPEGLAHARKLQQALQGATVEAILPDGTKITTKGIDADYGYGKNKDAADQAAYAAKRANKAAPADAQTRGERTRVGGAPAEGDQVQGEPQHSPDLTRQFAGTEHSTHTPLKEGEALPPGYVMSKIHFHAGDTRDIAVPMKIEFEVPADQAAWKLGERVREMFGWDKEPRPNTATPQGRQLIQDLRQYIHEHQPAWAQMDDRANLMYLRKFAKDVRDINVRAHNVNRDFLEQNFPDNPKGELRANPHKYAFSTKVPKWQPRDLVTKCF